MVACRAKSTPPIVHVERGGPVALCIQFRYIYPHQSITKCTVYLIVSLFTLYSVLASLPLPYVSVCRTDWSIRSASGRRGNKRRVEACGWGPCCDGGKNNYNEMPRQTATPKLHYSDAHNFLSPGLNAEQYLTRCWKDVASSPRLWKCHIFTFWLRKFSLTHLFFLVVINRRLAAIEAPLIVKLWARACETASSGGRNRRLMDFIAPQRHPPKGPFTNDVS